MSGVKQITFTRSRLEVLAERIARYARARELYYYHDDDPHDEPDLREAKKELERMLCVPIPEKEDAP